MFSIITNRTNQSANCHLNQNEICWLFTGDHSVGVIEVWNAGWTRDDVSGSDEIRAPRPRNTELHVNIDFF